MQLPEFAQTIRWCNKLVTSQSILHQATDDLLHLQISRSLPVHIDISELLNKLHNLQVRRMLINYYSFHILTIFFCFSSMENCIRMFTFIFIVTFSILHYIK